MEILFSPYFFSLWIVIFSDILERNNDYSDSLDFGREWVVVATFFILEVPDYKSAMLIYLLGLATLLVAKTYYNHGKYTVNTHKKKGDPSFFYQ